MFDAELDDPKDIFDHDDLNRNINFDEVECAIRGLKFNKAPGVDLIQNEYLRYGGRTLILCLQKLFAKCLEHEHVPNVWKRGIILPIFKGGNKSRGDPASYRPITLLCCTYKLFESVINNRIHDSLKTSLLSFPNDQQNGFRKSLSCTTATFSLQETIFHKS
ncbi:hypothetical protein CI610_03304 [invertebrate metagenome]|uniref:Reverse transcriptase domain-containing protein n=1 Tax=invertebrate metagenome TaxID=1711999 RepID=A0A2H9T3K3_9ZZZZ